MAAKKASAKKATPAPKKSGGNTRSANAAEKRVMDTKKQKTTRTDALGNKGMGRTGLTGNDLVKLGMAASDRAISKSKQPNSYIGFYKAQQEGAKAFNKSVKGNASYAVKGDTPAKRQLKEIIAKSNKPKKKK